MEILNFLSGLRGDPLCEPNWSPRLLYVALCVALPLTFGISVGLLLKAIERIFGIEIGKGGH